MYKCNPYLDSPKCSLPAFCSADHFFSSRAVCQRTVGGELKIKFCKLIFWIIWFFIHTLYMPSRVIITINKQNIYWIYVRLSVCDHSIHIFPMVDTQIQLHTIPQLDVLTTYHYKHNLAYHPCSTNATIMYVCVAVFVL